MKNKKLLKILITTFVTMLLSVGCSGISEPQTEIPEETADIEYEITNKDMDDSTDGAVMVDLDTVSDSIYEITDAGKYEFSGEYRGQILINVYGDEIVQLIFNNVDIESPLGSAIIANNSAKLIITAADNSVNTIRDSAYYPDEENEDDEISACIYSKESVTINGNGQLNVYGYYEEAIRTKEVLRVTGSTLNVFSKGTGLKGTDGVVVFDGTVTIQAEGGGIKSGKNSVVICGGNVNVVAGKMGIYANKSIKIQDAQVYVNAVKGKFKAEDEIDIEEGCVID